MTAPVSEAAFQQLVIELAQLLGWTVNHVRRSVGKGGRWTTATSVVGFPDLTCWHPRQGRVLFVELKSERGRLTAEQEAVLASLAAAGVETAVWRPSDLETAHSVLSGAS